MDITKFSPPQVPFEASSTLRAYLDDQMQRLSVLVNNAAQINEDAQFADVTADNFTDTGLGDTQLLFSNSGTIADAARLHYVNGVLRILDSGLTDYGAFTHNGTRFNTIFVNTEAWDLISLSALHLRDAGIFRIFDATDTDYAQFSHDGTDFNTVLVNTLDWNITGAVIKPKLPMLIAGEVRGDNDGDLGVEIGGRISASWSNRVQSLITAHNTGGPISAASAGDLVLIPRTSIAGNIWFATGTTSPTARLKIQGDGHIVLPNDNQELRFGIGNDLQISSDGTNAVLTATAAMLLNSAGGTRIIELGASGGLGFFNVATPVTRQTVTGSRGGNAALASLLTALANYGLITDNSTA